MIAGRKDRVGARPVGALFVWGAEGSFAGLTANVPEAGNTCSERLRVTD